MNKTLKYLSIFASILLAAASCSEKEGAYSFRCFYSATTGIDSTIVRNCIECTKANEYFKRDSHNYFGQYSAQVVPQAKTDFFNACIAVGDKPISDYLKEDECFIVSLVDAVSGEMVAYTTWIHVTEKTDGTSSVEESVKVPSSIVLSGF